MHLSTGTGRSVPAALAFVASLVACGNDAPGPMPADQVLDRTTWLGSSEGWGLLGVPAQGGALRYLGADSLEAPTWAPPELAAARREWAGAGGLWLEFVDGRIGLFDYRTGHLRTFEEFEGRVASALALKDRRGLVIALEAGGLTLLGGAEDWTFDPDGAVTRLERAGDGRIIVVADGDAGSTLLVLEPPQPEALGRRSVGGVRDLAVTSWGDRIYVLEDDPGADPAIHALGLPELEPAGAYPLPTTGRAVGVTPSGHRIYAAAGDRLHVFDRLTDRPIGDVGLPSPVSDLRFGLTGEYLLGRVADAERIAVLRVGVDSVLGLVDSEWGPRVPAALPGGRLVTRVGSELVLHATPALTEIGRAEAGGERLWETVEWHPPRPKGNVERAEADGAADAGRGSRDSGGRPAPGPVDTTGVASPGHYAVVSAARTKSGVADLVRWLGGLGYPATLSEYRDARGTLWYRAMVGPYRTRPRAEAAGRALGARYGYKPWILEIEAPEDDAPFGSDSLEAGAFEDDDDRGPDDRRDEDEDAVDGVER